MKLGYLIIGLLVNTWTLMLERDNRQEIMFLRLTGQSTNFIVVTEASS